MKTKTTLTSLIALIMVASMAIAGCSDDETHGSSLTQEIVDSVADAVADNLAEAIVEPAAPEMAEITTVADAAPVVSPDTARAAGDMVLVGQKLYSVFDGGVAIYDFTTKEKTVLSIEEKLEAIAVQQGTIYAGGDYLYVVAEDGLQRLDFEFEGVINCLEVHGFALMIGTERGLYSKGLLGREKLIDDVAVTALASQENSLWVGTDGQGLFTWDGDEFRKRFLLRDEHMFDTVRALDYQHNHLYVGTSNGFHIYNGGAWQNIDIADGLPTNAVTAIDASNWVVYVGTEAGMVSWFGGTIEPVEQFAGQYVTAIKTRGRNIMAATGREGILMKSGRMVTTLVDPEVEEGRAEVAVNQ